MTVAITGAFGFLGTHVSNYFQYRTDLPTKRGGREIWRDRASLDGFLRDAGAVVHLAGANRGPDAELACTNVALARQLADAIRAMPRPPKAVFYANTIRCDQDTPYGNSKREAGERLRAAAEAVGATFHNLLLPHLFGEGGRPFYNSVVFTFCHQLANGDTPRIVNDSELQLLHAQAVAERIHALLARPGSGGAVRFKAKAVTVARLLRILQGYKETYERQIFPSLRSRFALDLFNTYRSYLFPRFYPQTLVLRSDGRGSLFECIKDLNGGQVFMSTTKPDITRGNHFHFHKVERFLVVSGEAEIRIRSIAGDRTHSFRVSGEAPCYVDMPTFHTHNITNVGTGDLITLFWTNEIFDPDRPDTYALPV